MSNVLYHAGVDGVGAVLPKGSGSTPEEVDIEPWTGRRLL